MSSVLDVTRVAAAPDAGATVPGPAATSPGSATRSSRWRWVYVWAFRIAVASALVAAVFITVVPWSLDHGEVKLAFVTSGSMTPTLPVGSTIAYTRPADAAALRPGDIITFRALATGTVITHRILAVVRNENLVGVHYQTRGDANRAPDPDLVPAGNVIGLVSGPLPVWQQWAVDGQTPRGRLLVFGSLFLLVALGEIADLVRDRRRHGGHEGANVDAPA